MERFIDLMPTDRDTRLMPDDTIDRLCAAVDAASMMRHLEEFARRMKLSGTPEELESFRYLQATLDGYGFRTDLIQHDAYISLPGRARIEIGSETPDCITHSFSRASAPGGLRAPVVYAGRGRPEDFAALDVRGRIVLLESIANPAASLRASQAGAAGQIHISPHEHLHEMCISSVWGSPTGETLDHLPRTVVLSVRKATGDALKHRVQAGETVEVVLHAEVETGWRKTPLLVADLPGPTDESPFVMFSGHHDTWYYGVMDNGGANATMLEVARLFAAERAVLRRGLRICFWSGHSHGRYSGSTWYADTHWDELVRRCVAHVNVDSTGARGNTVMVDAQSSAELGGLAARSSPGPGRAGTRGSAHEPSRRPVVLGDRRAVAVHGDGRAAGGFGGQRHGCHHGGLLPQRRRLRLVVAHPGRHDGQDGLFVYWCATRGSTSTPCGAC